MRAVVQTLPYGLPASPVEVICNQLEPVLVSPRRPAKHYKKVGKEVRAKLLKCVQNGWSIINVLCSPFRSLANLQSTIQPPSRLCRTTGKRARGSCRRGPARLRSAKPLSFAEAHRCLPILLPFCCLTPPLYTLPYPIIQFHDKLG